MLRETPQGPDEPFYYSAVVAQVYIPPIASEVPVISINQDLENMVQGKRYPDFKSEGERRIASFLQNNTIRYQYEPGVLINSVCNKPRIWYPYVELTVM